MRGLYRLADCEEEAAAGEQKAASSKRPSSFAPVVGYRDIYWELHLKEGGIPKVLMLLGGDSDTGGGEAPSWYSSAAMRFKQGRTKAAAFFAVAAGRDVARTAPSRRCRPAEPSLSARRARRAASTSHRRAEPGSGPARCARRWRRR